MRVVCENCGATYKIPESKLTKEVNKATCRKCGFRMMIRRSPATAVPSSPHTTSEDAATQVTANPLEHQQSERELLEAHTRIQKQIEEEWSDEAPTQVQVDPLASPSAKPRGGPPRANTDSTGKAPGDMLLALIATFAAAAGPMLLATNTGDVAVQRMVGLMLGLLGALTCLFLLITGNLWRQKGNIPISIALATVLSMGGTAFVEIAIYGPPSPPPAAEVSTPKVAETDAKEELAGDAETGEPAVADAAEVPEPPAPKEEEPTPPVEEPLPIDPEEDLEEPDMDEIPSSATRSDAEEARRREMEEAAARARADREARDAERERREREAKRTPEPEASGPPKMKSLPLTVVDTMIRSNMSVKRCFFNEKEASGSLPRRVDVRFTVMPTGRISSARVTTAEYKGSTLDSCLARAFKAIAFPAFEGDPLSMTYPFIL